MSMRVIKKKKRGEKMRKKKGKGKKKKKRVFSEGGDSKSDSSQ